MLPQLQVHEDYQEDLEYESSDSDEAGGFSRWVICSMRPVATAATQEPPLLE